MNVSRRAAVVAAATALAVGGVIAVSAASAEPRTVAPRATTTTWAKVSAGGIVFGSEGVSRVNKFGTGRYNITTTSNLAGCALLGTVNSSGGTDPGPGSASIMVGLVNGNTLFVRTATPSGTGNAVVDSDRPFSITAVC
ncbi:hypothetical protein [Streptomyces sp. NPDC059378]|uniref:hypothetical protein n=1 Tax=Streptomyces sp. NPDC059378 TaxID=3346815 RepID=UPI0036845FE6